MIGTIDRAKQFHPFAMMISKKEEAVDFSYLFTTIVNKSKELFDFEYKPSILLADHFGF